VPYDGVEDVIEERGYNQGYLIFNICTGKNLLINLLASVFTAGAKQLQTLTGF